MAKTYSNTDVGRMYTVIGRTVERYPDGSFITKHHDIKTKEVVYYPFKRTPMGINPIGKQASLGAARLALGQPEHPARKEKHTA